MLYYISQTKKVFNIFNILNSEMREWSFLVWRLLNTIHSLIFDFNIKINLYKKMNNKKIKYFIYARKSSESEDRQINSIEDQKAILKDLAKRENLEVVEILEESGSAKKPGRKVFNEMLERIYKGEAQGIIAWKLNRLARNPIDGGNISYALQTNVIKQIVTIERIYRPEDNVLMMAVELGMANQFINDLSKDTKRGLLEKAKRGWAPYLAPLGYMKHPEMKKGEKEIIIDEERFHLVRKIWDLILSGNYNPAQALEILNNKYGLRTRKGTKVSTSTVYQILRNPFYYGEFEYPKGSGNWYKGKHKPMITKSEFDKVQLLISNHSKTVNNSELKNLFPYKGRLKCGSCGQSINAERKKRITCDCKHRFSALKTTTCPKCGLDLKNMKNPKVEERIYYICRNKSCEEKTTTEQEIENSLKIFFNKLKELPEELINFIYSIIERIEKLENKNNVNNILNLEKNIKNKKEELKKLIRMKMNNEIDSDTFMELQKETKEEIKKLENIKNNYNSDDTKNKLKYYINFGKNISEIFEKSDKIKKKEIFNSISSNHSLIGGKIVIPKDSPFLNLIELSNAYTSRNSTLRTTKNPYFSTKKTPSEVLDSEMLHE